MNKDLIKYEKLKTKLADSIVARAKLNAEYDEHRLATLRKVEMTKVGETVTLKFGDRVLKAKKNARYGRYKVTDGKTTVVAEYFGGIHDLRFAMALETV
jgi:hypothetical protein